MNYVRIGGIALALSVVPAIVSSDEGKKTKSHKFEYHLDSTVLGDTLGSTESVPLCWKGHEEYRTKSVDAACKKEIGRMVLGRYQNAKVGPMSLDTTYVSSSTKDEDKKKLSVTSMVQSRNAQRHLDNKYKDATITQCVSTTEVECFYVPDEETVAQEQENEVADELLYQIKLQELLDDRDNGDLHIEFRLEYAERMESEFHKKEFSANDYGSPRTTIECTKMFLGEEDNPNPSLQKRLAEKICEDNANDRILIDTSGSCTFSADFFEKVPGSRVMGQDNPFKTKGKWSSLRQAFFEVDNLNYAGNCQCTLEAECTYVPNTKQSTDGKNKVGFY